MATDLTILRNGALPSTAFKDANLPKTRLDEGTAGSPFARVSYKAGKWAVKFQGKFDPATRIVDGRREQNPNLDVVILKAANHPSKAWYAAAYNPEAEQTGPDCYSSLGMKPDLPGSRKPQNDTCLLCPHNAWGSKVDRQTGEARKGKDCMDFKKLAVVPVFDIENKIYGGPMLLQVPASSLRNLGPYQNLLEANGFHYAQVHTRVTFSGDENISYPLMEFDALSALDDVQAQQVLKALNHPLINLILDGEVQAADAGEDAYRTPSATVTVLRPATKKEEAKPAKAADPNVVQPKPELSEAEQEIADLKAKLAATIAATPPPLPPLTPQEQEIIELKAKLAEAANAANAAIHANAGETDRRALPSTYEKKGKGGRPRGSTNRTPAVAPTDMDSEKLAGPALPEPVGEPANDGEGEDPIARINRTIANAKGLI